MDGLQAGEVYMLAVVPTGFAPQAATDEARSSSELLHELFEKQAEAHPTAIAVRCGTDELTYAELDAQANQLANYLRGIGIGQEDRVGLLIPRSLEVYIGLLGILKSGAAYVPIDPEYPADRTDFILTDCDARALLTVRRLAGKAGNFGGRVVCLDAEVDKVFQASSARPIREGGVGSSSLCYVIYTSGTTGRPKGVQIEHRSVCHLVRAEARIFQVQAEDRVYQGFSIAFDASVEEIWLALFAGATLVAATPEMAYAGPGLATALTHAGVTVLSCVPTLLAMLEEDVPSIRLLILGGEPCPPDLVNRWWKPGRRVINTYGPTEATVIATYAELRLGEPVTIGKPLPNYTVAILDDQLRSVDDGTAGELCLGGVGLARDYLGLPDQTREKFILWSPEGSPPQRLYRTGDLVRRTPSGDLEFLGRRDNQVKVRGYRIELSEIEAVLMESPGIRSAAVTLFEREGGIPELIGYVIPKDSRVVDLNYSEARLRERLPNYMVPSRLEIVPEFPVLPSGKIDRKRLPKPMTERQGRSRPVETPRTALESRIAEAWRMILGTKTVSIQDNLFLDYGGHSLLAARIVSELRKTSPFEVLSMADVYNYPTIKSLAAQFETRSHTFSPASAGHVKAAVPFWRHFWCGAAQAVSLIFVLSFFALQWLAPYLTYTILIEEDYDFVPSVLGALASLVVLYPLMLMVPIALKWLVIGRYRPGSYPLWGSYYFKWWLVTTVEAAVPVSYLAGTPLLNIYLRLMGAKIGRDVHLGCNNFAVYDLLSIGDGTSINVDSHLLGYTVEDGFLKLGRVLVGCHCFVGARATVCRDATMEDNSALEDLSLLPRGVTMPAGETWDGSPAQPKESTPHRPAQTPSPSGGDHVRRLWFGFLHAIGLLIFPVLVVAALFPGIVVMNKLNYLDPYYWYLFLSPLAGVSFVLLLCLEIAALKWLLLGKVKAGRHSTQSLYYVRKWFVDQTLDLSLEILGPLYASVYLTPWYKLLGAHLGSGAEISTASFISPDLLSIGEESFIADNVSLGAPRIRDGFMWIGPNRIGTRSFVGNSALLPPGTELGDNVLVGCLSRAPFDPPSGRQEEATWLGSPPMCLPQRQQSTAFGEERTYAPTATLRVLRAAIEFVRVIAPSTCFIILLSLLFSSLLLLHDQFSLWQTLLFFPVLYLACGIAASIITIGAKWLLVWRYKPQERPLWSTFVWRNELVNALHEHLAEPFLVGPLSGTPFICWYFRALGAKIRRRVYMETTDLTEFDLVQVGEETALNADCTIQTHLFEDRVMKMSRIDIGRGCRVGEGSLVLYDTRMEDGTWLGDLSLLMKNEVLPADSRWEGIPARAVTTENSPAKH